MAVKLGAMDTHIVLTALWDYRETLTNGISPNPPHIQARIASVDRLIKAYKKSYFALDRLGIA
jgi:3-deoxy-D-arabino-heptulosonate 7-phosphate (DAHP) synthase class II